MDITWNDSPRIILRLFAPSIAVVEKQNPVIRQQRRCGAFAEKSVKAPGARTQRGFLQRFPTPQVPTAGQKDAAVSPIPVIIAADPFAGDRNRAAGKHFSSPLPVFQIA